MTEDIIYEGLFYYNLEVIDTLGQLHIIGGQACALICEENKTFPVDYSNCAFGIQHDGQGGFNPVIDPMEDACL